jgi:hypothetical protein
VDNYQRTMRQILMSLLINLSIYRNLLDILPRNFFYKPSFLQGIFLNKSYLGKLSSIWDTNRRKCGYSEYNTSPPDSFLHNNYGHLKLKFKCMKDILVNIHYYICINFHRTKLQTTKMKIKNPTNYQTMTK